MAPTLPPTSALIVFSSNAVLSGSTVAGLLKQPAMETSLVGAFRVAMVVAVGVADSDVTVLKHKTDSRKTPGFETGEQRLDVHYQINLKKSYCPKLFKTQHEQDLCATQVGYLRNAVLKMLKTSVFKTKLLAEMKMHGLVVNADDMLVSHNWGAKNFVFVPPSTAAPTAPAAEGKVPVPFSKSIFAATAAPQMDHATATRKMMDAMNNAAPKRDTASHTAGTASHTAGAALGFAGLFVGALAATLLLLRRMKRTPHAAPAEEPASKEEKASILGVQQMSVNDVADAHDGADAVA